MDQHAVFSELFQQPGAYPYPFGSTCMADLYDMDDAALHRLPWPRLRDQAVAVDEVFAEWKGRYLVLLEAIRRVGPLPALLALQDETVAALCRIQGQQRRLRRLLDACKQPWRGVERN
jgi:hypothetical protein